MDYVWYAAFGSNLSEARFNTYLMGGAPPHSDPAKVQRGSRQPVPAVAQDHLTEPNAQLMFAYEAKRWNGGGVAFVRWLEEPNGSDQTVFRLHKITRTQFEDLHAQECGLADPLPLPAELPGRGEHVDLSTRLYGRLLGLGQHADGLAMLTITGAQTDVAPNQPSVAYARTVAEGAMETMGWSQAEAAAYLLTKPGFATNFTASSLADYIFG